MRLTVAIRPLSARRAETQVETDHWNHAITDGAVDSRHQRAWRRTRLAARRRRARNISGRPGPAWPRHAPVLFPIVGRLAGDQLRHGGSAYRLTQHGFARDRVFAWLERGPRFVPPRARRR